MKPRPAARSARITLALSLALGASLAAAAALASGTPSTPPKPAPKAQEPGMNTSLLPGKADSAAIAAQSRARAEDLYWKAYKETDAAKADLKAGKKKEAEKKFAKALKRFDEATRLAPEYYQAWNMLGFTSRKTGDLKRAFAAYHRSLELNPDYDEAHEYLGEAYVLSGDLAKAKEQLAWLQAKKSEEAAELEETIRAAEAGTAAHGAAEQGAAK